MLRSEKLLTDVTLWATDLNETSSTAAGQTTTNGNISNDFPAAVVPFFAHKAVLAASSDYFRAMFNASGNTELLSIIVGNSQAAKKRDYTKLFCCGDSLFQNF